MVSYITPHTIVRVIRIPKQTTSAHPPRIRILEVGKDDGTWETGNSGPPGTIR